MVGVRVSHALRMDVYVWLLIEASQHGTRYELKDVPMEDPDDWIIDSNGFYVATRSFLIRRGYCCANQCRNCPYINWHNSPTWEPLPAEAVHFTEVSPKAVEGARKALTYHEQQVQDGSQTEEALHQAMIAHYRLLLERWEESRG